VAKRPLDQTTELGLAFKLELHPAAAPQKLLHLLHAQLLGLLHLKCHPPASSASSPLQAHPALDNSAAKQGQFAR
jgi:hypothetical protein